MGKVTQAGKLDWEQQVKELVDKYLEQRFPSYLDKYATVGHQSDRKGRQLDTHNKEFWFVRERAKYLGKEITASQLIHIELYANDVFKKGTVIYLKGNYIAGLSLSLIQTVMWIF